VTELRHEDFDELDIESVSMAGNHLVVELQDLVHHHWDGDGWATWPEPHEDAAQAALVVRDMLEQAETAVRQARTYLADAERRARLRAMRRERAAGGGAS
jgi:uncharacterized protein YukE